MVVVVVAVAGLGRLYPHLSMSAVAKPKSHVPDVDFSVCHRQFGRSTYSNHPIWHDVLSIFVRPVSV
jgi:hypothetical protein